MSNIKKDIIKDTYYLSYKNHIKYEELGKRLNEIKINNFDNLINLSDEKNIVNEIFYYYENMFFYFLKKLKNNSLFVFHSNYDIYNQFNLNSNLESLNLLFDFNICISNLFNSSCNDCNTSSVVSSTLYLSNLD